MSINIRQKRFTVLVNNILKEELRKGNLPTSKEFSTRLNKALRQQDLGGPEYKFKQAKNSEVAESEFYNQAVQRIQKDLMILLENTFAVHGELKGKFNWFEVEKNRLEYEVRSLQNVLEEKIHLYGKTGYLASVFDVFDDLSKVSAEEDVSIDIKKHEVTLKEQENASFVIKPKSKIHFIMPERSISSFKRIKISGKIEDTLSNGSDETYQEVWLSRQQGSASGYVDIVFERNQTMNRIDLGIHTIKDATVYVEFSLDGQTYYHLPYYTEGKVTNDKVSFHFPKTQMKQLKIWIDKSESDKEMVHPEGYQYQYLFGVKDISFYDLSFPEKGVFTTTTLTPDTDESFSIGKVSLVVDEEIPDGTDIEYYVRVDETEESWRAISPVGRNNAIAPSLIDFKHVVRAKPTHLGIDADISGEESEIIELKANGVKFYSIGSIEKREIIPRTERLYVGKNAWSVQESSVDHGASHIPDMKDWHNVVSVKKNILPIPNGKESLLMKEERHTFNKQKHYSTSLFYEGSENIVSTIPSSTEPITIYLNGVKLYEGIPNSRTKVNYRFKQGWNEIAVLVYIQSINKDAMIDIGFNPIDESTECYATSKNLEKVSLFDLRYNVKNNDWSKYALYEKNDKVYVVVNHSLPGITYELYYDYIDKNKRTDIQLKAVLKQFSIGQYTTPVLKRYALHFS